MNFIATCPYILGDDSNTFGKKYGICGDIIGCCFSECFRDCSGGLYNYDSWPNHPGTHVLCAGCGSCFAKTFLLSQQRTRCWLMNAASKKSQKGRCIYCIKMEQLIEQWLNPFSRLLHWDCWEISYQHLRQPVWNQDIKWSFGSSCLAALWVTNHWWFCSKCWHPQSPRIKHQGKQHSKESRLVVLIALYLHQLGMLRLGQVNLDTSKIQLVCRLIVIWFTDIYCNM